MPSIWHRTREESHRAHGPVGVTVVGTLPPVKGVSPYTSQLLGALATDPAVRADFTGFKSIYPRGAYPGGDPDEAGAVTPSFDGVRVRNTLTWYNPISWLRAGMGARGDIVHAQWWSYALAPVYATVLGIGRLRGKRVLLTVHNVEPHEGGFVKRALNRLVFRFAHAYIVHSEQNREALQRALGCPPERITVLPHGVLGTPRTGMSRSAARAALGLPAGAKTVLCFGNIRPYKGVDVLMRAFAGVVAEQPDARLIIAGQPWEDWAPYQRLIDELDLASAVTLRLEYVPTAEIERYFVAADVVVLPYTHFDAQSGVGARALPFGRPLIVSDTGGLRELVLDPEAVVPPANVRALTQAIARVLADEAVRDRMSVESLTLAAALGWDNIAARTIELYRAVSGARPAAQPNEQPATEPAGAAQP